MLLIEAEKAFLQQFHLWCPAIVEAIYADSIDDLLAKDSIVKYPSLVYTREDSAFTLPKAYDVYSTGDVALDRLRMFAFVVKYTARLVVERQVDMVQYATQIRSGWADSSYAYVRTPDYDEGVAQPVGMKLLSFTFRTNRDNLEKSGAQRVLEMTWESQLALDVYSGNAFPQWDSYRLRVVPEGIVSEAYIVEQGILE